MKVTILFAVCIVHLVLGSGILNESGSLGKFSILKKACLIGGSNGTCMFHYECQTQNGSVLGACLDGFLFGVCCDMRNGHKFVNKVTPDELLDFVDNLLTSTNASAEKTNTSTHPQVDAEEHSIEVKSADIENMMTSILTNVLSEFDSNIEPLLHILIDQDNINSTGLSEIHQGPLLKLNSTQFDMNNSQLQEVYELQNSSNDTSTAIVENLSVTTFTTTPTLMNTDITTSSSNITSSTENIPSTVFNYKEDCGVRPIRGQGRIVGGTEAKFGDWPWQVLVKESTWLGLFTKNKCGGVLISDQHVLTAAHCQPGFLASLIVELGEFDLTGPTEHMGTMRRKVKRVVVHKDYKAPTFENDIAILELEEPIERKPHIVPICLPDLDNKFEGRTAIVTGWGRLSYGGSVPNILHQVSVPIMNNTKCQSMFTSSGHKKIVRDSFLCAGYDEGKKDSCEGDSGGPLMVQQPDSRWVLVGTVSHGIKCAYPDLPGVYMRMTFYKPWIQKITGIA